MLNDDTRPIRSPMRTTLGSAAVLAVTALAGCGGGDGASAA